MCGNRLWDEVFQLTKRSCGGATLDYHGSSLAEQNHHNKHDSKCQMDQCSCKLVYQQVWRWKQELDSKQRLCFAKEMGLGVFGLATVPSFKQRKYSLCFFPSITLRLNLAKICLYDIS